MGAYKYMNEIWRRKQSETMRYLQRVRLNFTIRYLKFLVTKLWFRFVSGNTETWTPSTGLQDQLVLKRHDDWDTRPLKVSSFTGIG